MTVRKIDPDDLVVWPDGTQCRHCDLHTMAHMGDDYEVVPAGSDRWHELESQED